MAKWDCLHGLVLQRRLLLCSSSYRHVPLSILQATMASQTRVSCPYLFQCTSKDIILARISTQCPILDDCWLNGTCLPSVLSENELDARPTPFPALVQRTVVDVQEYENILVEWQLFACATCLLDRTVCVLWRPTLNTWTSGIKVQWLRLALSKGPNGVGISPLSSGDGNRSIFRNIVFSCIQNSGQSPDTQ
jgi:hypothetical protein